jgi:hypothetical protein
MNLPNEILMIIFGHIAAPNSPQYWQERAKLRPVCRLWTALIGQEYVIVANSLPIQGLESAKVIHIRTGINNYCSIGHAPRVKKIIIETEVKETTTKANKAIVSNIIEPNLALFGQIDALEIDYVPSLALVMWSTDTNLAFNMLTIKYAGIGMDIMPKLEPLIRHVPNVYIESCNYAHKELIRCKLGMDIALIPTTSCKNRHIEPLYALNDNDVANIEHRVTQGGHGYLDLILKYNMS